MAELKIHLSIRKGWLFRLGLPGAFVVLCLMKAGAPARWFFSVNVLN